MPDPSLSHRAPVSCDTDCFACNGELNRTVLGLSGYRYIACSACGMARLDPFPAPESVEQLYDADYFEGGRGGGYDDYLGGATMHQRNAQRRMATLGEAAPEPGTLIDVGCAAGFFLAAARDAGWHAHGADVSAWAREHALQYGFRVAPHLGHPSLPEAADAVTIFQTLSHVPDPAALLQAAAQQLRSGGTLIVETWDRESMVARAFGTGWQQAAPPAVLHLFTRKSLETMLHGAGFELLHWKTTMKWVSTGQVASALRPKSKSLHYAVKWIGRAAGNEELVLPYWGDDLVTLVAHRR